MTGAKEEERHNGTDNASAPPQSAKARLRQEAMIADTMVAPRERRRRGRRHLEGGGDRGDGT